MGTRPHGNSSIPRLVVFGCGYVGEAIARAALGRHWAMTALTRNPATAERLRRSEIRTVVGNLADDSWYPEIEPGPDLVVNCVSAGGRGVAGYRESYVDGMRSMLQWMGTRGEAGTVVYTSSTSVYPNSGGEEVDESAPVAARDERAQLLIDAERTLMDGAACACRRWFIVRLAGIYGPGRHHLLEQVRSGGGVAGFGEHRLNLIHRDDIVAAVMACLTAPDSVRDRVFNVVDDEPAPKKSVTDWLAGRIGVPAPSFSGTPAEGRSAKPLDRKISNAAIKAALGWRPQFPSFREGYEAILRSEAV